MLEEKGLEGHWTRETEREDEPWWKVDPLRHGGILTLKSGDALGSLPARVVTLNAVPAVDVQMWWGPPLLIPALSSHPRMVVAVSARSLCH